MKPESSLSQERVENTKCAQNTVSSHIYFLSVDRKRYLIIDNHKDYMLNLQ